MNVPAPTTAQMTTTVPEHEGHTVGGHQRQHAVDGDREYKHCRQNHRSPGIPVVKVPDDEAGACICANHRDNDERIHPEAV